ncbi:hypothetical protein KUCAC02_001944, partial [Chaenocephalus aceratus]
RHGYQSDLHVVPHKKPKLADVYKRLVIQIKAAWWKRCCPDSASKLAAEQARPPR